MKYERWQQVKELCARAFDVPKSDREDFLDAVCGDDTALRREIQSLLVADADSGRFIVDQSLADWLRRGSAETRLG